MKKAFTILAFLHIFAAGAMVQATKAVDSITPVDTIDIMLDNAMVNEVNDLIDYYGVLQIRGADSIQAYLLNLEIYTDTLARTYTSSDINWEESVLFYNNQIISISEIRDFTVTGNTDTCSTNLEIIS